MPKFQYQGRDKSGKKVQGVVEGTNESVVALELARHGTIPLSISPYVAKSFKFSKFLALLTFNSISAQDLNFFCRQMYSLIKAGVPMIRSTQIVMASTKNKQFKAALADIVLSLESGQSLSLSMRHHSQLFPTLMIAIVEVGENTGHLDQAFRQLAIHFERENTTRRQIAAAIRYPLMVVIVTIIAVVVINIFVIPAFARFFAQFKAQLPLPTRILIAISNFFVHYWYVLIMGVGSGIFLIFSFLKTPLGHRRWDRWKLSIPIAGDIVKRALLARFARSFALSIRSGVPLLESINIIAKTTDNVYVSEQIITMRTYIEHGESLTVSAGKTQMFTPLILQMLSIGEETGELDRLLDEAADYYEQEVDYEVERLGDAIEPILILIIAGFVLLLALGIFLPMWDLWRAALGK